MKNIAVVLTIFIMLFMSLDYGIRQQASNTEAIVAYKKMAAVAHVGQSPFVLILTRGDRAWAFRVSRSFYHSVDVEDRLMLTTSRGYITGTTYHITFDEKIHQ